MALAMTMRWGQDSGDLPTKGGAELKTVSHRHRVRPAAWRRLRILHSEPL
jgi:hypothetical protein